MLQSYDMHDKTMHMGESYVIVEGIHLSWKTKYSAMSVVGNHRKGEVCSYLKDIVHH